LDETLVCTENPGLTKNGFSDIDFVYDVEILAAFRLVMAIFIAHAKFRPYYGDERRSIEL